MRCPSLDAAARRSRRCRSTTPSSCSSSGPVGPDLRSRSATPTRPAIAEICHRLDGIPLAIELAAARCRQMSAERIATELDDRFRLLTGGARTVVARQQTLAASVDWSHDRLDEAERIAFRRLGVFAGPFPLEAAEAVVAADGRPRPGRGLRPDQPPRRQEPRRRRRRPAVASPATGCWRRLRAYALDRARTAGELTILRDAHAAWWADWLEPRGAMPTDDILEEIEEFHANLKAALDWSADDPALGLRLLRDVAVAWEDLGRAGDAMAAADRLLTDDNAQRYSAEWLAAAWRTSFLYFSARGRGGVDAVPRAHRSSRGTTRRRVLPAAGTLAEGAVLSPMPRGGTWPASRATATCRPGCRSSSPATWPKTTRLRPLQS